MPISATGNSAARHFQRTAGREAGFTLVELLVVVFIIALMSTLVVLSLPDSATPLRTMTEKMALKLHQASRESILSGEAVALSMGPEGAVRFERYRDGAWREEDVHHLSLKQSEGVERIVLTVSHEGDVLRPHAASPRSVMDSEEPSFTREVIFSPLGEATPAEIRLQDGAEEAIIRVGAGGEVAFEMLSEARF